MNLLVFIFLPVVSPALVRGCQTPVLVTLCAFTGFTEETAACDIKVRKLPADSQFAAKKKNQHQIGGKKYVKITVSVYN